MASQGSAWYVDFFRADYLNVYGHMFTEERAEKESAFVASALGLKPGASVLDLCCGQGRHSVQLAKRGLRGDQSRSESRLPGTREAGGQGGQRHNRDRRRRHAQDPFRNKFDAIVNMYSSFGYLESEAEDLKVLESAAKALKAGGQLLLDMLNREWAIDNYIQNDWHTGADGTLYVERRDLDLATSRMHVHFIVVDPEGKPPRVGRTYHPALHADRDHPPPGTRGAARDGGVRGIRQRGVCDRYAADDRRRAQVGASRAVPGEKSPGNAWLGARDPPFCGHICEFHE